MFKKLACFTGWLLVLCMSLMFCFTLGLWQNWSTLTILFFWLLMLVMAVLLWCAIQGVVLIIKGKKGRRWLAKYRLSRREFVLREHWKSGASIIKRVRRQREGLPWYLLVGDRCGKSTLLASAGLPRFYGDNDDAVTGPTRTLRWWFFRQLCILELSSNFINGVATFRQAWGKLAQWCKRMPMPAGIIIALPVSALMSGDINALHALARQQRALIEPLVRRFGDRLPLYIIVTQCDHFPGFSLWQQQLSPAQRQQPLGYSWDTPPHIDGQDELVLQPLFSSLKQGMSRVRLSMARPVGLNAEENAILLDFPEAFARLESTLRYAIASLCEPNAYFSHSRLDSVWFSATEPQTENRSRRTGVFIRDLLTGHLRDLSQRRGGQRWYQRPQGKRVCAVGLAVITLWVIISARLSFNHLQTHVVQLSPNALATFLAEDEQRPVLSLRYLPFLPLIEQQQKRAESLLAQAPTTQRQARITLAEYQQQVLNAESVHQRELILSLANAVLTWQQMRDGASLNELQQAVPIAAELRQRDYPETLAPLSILALERYFMLRPDGERWLQSARQLLGNLVNHDPALNWLVAPATMLPPLQAATYWPLLPETLALPGIWTRKGNVVLHEWITQIERAIGHPQSVFQQIERRWSTERQNVWRQYLIDVSAGLSPVAPAAMSRSHLIALGQNQSQAMQFVAQTLNELDDIPAQQAQPWLEMLRQLQQLAIAGNSSAMLRRITHLDDRMRLSLTSWLQGTAVQPRTDNVPPAEQVWNRWQSVRSEAVKEAVAQGKPGEHLTRGLFVKQNNSDRNPLTELFPALASVQERLTPQNHDASIAAVWSFYKDDAYRLLAKAMFQSACWLNTQWQSLVIWPLGKDEEQRSYEEQQVLSLQSVSDFLRIQAKSLLSLGNNGPEAASYAGMQIPLTTEFLRLTRHTFPVELFQDVPQRKSTRESDQRALLQAKVAALELQQNALEKKVWKITVASQPVTIPGGAQVIPTGTQLTLNCLKGDQQLNSMNFAEKYDFSWQPGLCSGVTLNVIFPGFNVRYQLKGDDAWPEFVNRFTSGEALFESREFGNSSGLLEQIGIKHILVRFVVSEPQEMITAWQAWHGRAQEINHLNDRIAFLNNSSESQHINPLSALPGNIAQCQ